MRDIISIITLMNIIKTVLWLCSLLLLSCYKQSHWALDHIHSDNSSFSSSRLVYDTADPVHGIDLEILNAQERLTVYLNLHSLPLSQKDVAVKMKIEGVDYLCPVYCFSGGQRLMLEESAAKMLMEALSNDKEISLSLPGYHSLFKPEDFSSKFKKLLKPSSSSSLIMRFLREQA